MGGKERSGKSEEYEEEEEEGQTYLVENLYDCNERESIGGMRDEREKEREGERYELRTS